MGTSRCRAVSLRAIERGSADLSAPGRRSLPVEVGGELDDEVLGVGAGAVDEARLPTAQEGRADQVHARGVDDTAVVAQETFAIENRHVEPRVVRAVAGRPDDGPDLA